MSCLSKHCAYVVGSEAYKSGDLLKAICARHIRSFSFMRLVVCDAEVSTAITFLNPVFNSATTDT